MPAVIEVVTEMAADPAVVFVDEQTRGPFRAMHHEHLFEALGNGRTRMTDRMSITAPAGLLGAVVYAVPDR